MYGRRKIDDYSFRNFLFFLFGLCVIPETASERGEGEEGKEGKREGGGKEQEIVPDEKSVVNFFP
jgi:hypothetical protein